MIASLIVVGLPIDVSSLSAPRRGVVEPLVVVVVGILVSFLPRLPHLPTLAVESEVVLSVTVPLPL